MKVILIGYPGSQFLVPASKYLAQKYLPGFDLHYLNWTGEKDSWSGFVAGYLTGLQDEFVIFALDDYLISDFIDLSLYQEALLQFEKDKKLGCAKLCETTIQEHCDYPVTTQYCIWRREALISLLSKTKDPWHFEMTGSALWREMPWQSVCASNPILKYDVHSALSSRWPGEIKWDGIKEEDIEYIKNNNLI